MSTTHSTPYSVGKSLLKMILRKGVRSFYPQSGEDAILLSAIKKSSGTYIDVGAYHPILYSNTYAFYNRGWKGLAIDPNPKFKKLFSFFRPRDTFVCAGVAEKEGVLTYHKFSDAAYNTFDTESTKEYEKLRWLNSLGTEEVSVLPLASILRKEKITTIDFLNVDVEGKDLDVLRSHDWNIPTQVIAVEDRHFSSHEPQKSPIYNFLHEKGYVLTGLTRDTLIFTLRNVHE